MAVYGGTRILLLDSFEALEEKQMSADLTRLDSALKREIEQLQVIVIDWAEWDNSYHYMGTPNLEYEQSNIVDSTFSALDISAIIYLDNAAKVKKQFGFDLKEQQAIEVSTTDLRTLEHYHQPISNRLSGIVKLKNTQYLFISNEIIKSDGSGPARGYLAMLKIFDSKVIEKLSNQTLLNVEYIPFENFHEVTLSLYTALNNNHHWLKHSDENTVVGISLLKDLLNEPAGYFKVTSKRHVFNQGLHTLKYFTYLLALAGVFFFTLVLWVLRWALLKRLLNLSHNLIDIGSNHHRGKLVEVQGNDEITIVAKAVNQMLGGLERFYLQQQYHQEHQRIQNELLVNLAKEPCLINGSVALAAKKITEIVLHGCQVNHASVWLLNESKDAYICIDSLIETINIHQSGAKINTEDVLSLSKELKLNGVLDIKNGNQFKDGFALLKVINPDNRPNSLYITAIHLQGDLHGFIISQSFHIDSQYRLTDETFLLSISEFLEQTIIVQERNRLEETLRQQACHDNLTSIANRHYFYKLLNEAIDSSSINQVKMAILFIDLDNFKPVNDTHGHNIGDELLKMCAKRMNNILPENGTVARLGGDEFIVLLNPLTSLQDSQRLAQKLVHTLSDIFSIQGKTISISCSIGISYFPQHSTNPDDLITFADRAMYQAKQKGRNNYLVYTPPT